MSSPALGSLPASGASAAPREVLASSSGGGIALLVGIGAGLLTIGAIATGSLALFLAGIVGLALVALLVARPVLGLYLSAAVIPIERLGRLGDDSAMYTVSLMRIVGALALGALILNSFVRRRRFVFGSAFVVYASYVGLCLTTLTHTTDPVKSVQMIGTFIGNLLFFFLILNLARDKRAAEWAVTLWLAASVLAGLYAVYDWHFGSGERGGIAGSAQYDPGRGEQRAAERFSTVWQDRGEFESLSGVSARRSMGFTSHALVYGINLILTLPFFCWRLRDCGPVGRVALLAGLGVVSYNLLLTNTRSVLLVAVFAGGLCVVRGLVRLRASHLGALVLIAVAALAFAPVDVYNRILSVANYSPEHAATLRIRFAYWEAATRIIEDHWLVGIGAGNEFAVPRYVTIDAPEETNVHNDYLQTMMEAGIPGGLLFYSFVGLLLWTSFRAAAAVRRRAGPESDYWFLVAAQVAMMATLAYGLQVDVFHFPLKGWWLVAGLVWVKRWPDRAPSPEPLRGQAA